MPVIDRLPLDLLNDGDLAEILEVDGEHAFVARAAEMGLREGVCVQMLRNGSPCLLDVNGARICLRPDGCQSIWVKPTGRRR